MWLWVGDIVRATIYRTIRASKYDTISCPLGTKIVRQIIFEEQNIEEKISKSSEFFNTKTYSLFVCLFNFYFMFVPLRAELFFNSSLLIMFTLFGHKKK